MEPINWIESRAAKEIVLQKQAPELWNAVRSALQDACDGFNEHYAFDTNQPEVSCKPENGRRILITIKRRERDREFSEEMIVRFSEESYSIEYNSSRLNLSSDDTQAFVVQHDGQRLDPDAVSRCILEPFFFKNGESKKPRR
jgi:hypothetical protein